MTCNNITGVLGSFYSKQVFNFVWGKDIETQKSFAARNRLFTFTEFPNVGFTEFPNFQVFLHIYISFLHFHCGTKGVSELWRLFQSFQSPQFKFAIIGKGLVVDALPNLTMIGYESQVWLHQEYSTTT